MFATSFGRKKSKGARATRKPGEEEELAELSMKKGIDAWRRGEVQEAVAECDRAIGLYERLLCDDGRPELALSLLKCYASKIQALRPIHGDDALAPLVHKAGVLKQYLDNRDAANRLGEGVEEGCPSASASKDAESGGTPGALGRLVSALNWLLVGKKRYKGRLSRLQRLSVQGKHIDALAWFGGRLRTLRQKRGLTLEAVARQIGVAPPTFYSWETVREVPSVAQLVAIASVLDCDLDDILPEAGG